MSKKSHFKVVYIPSCIDKKIEEWDIPLPEFKDDEISCLTTCLRQHFKKQGNVSDEKSQKAFKEQILKQIPAGQNVDDNAINMILQMESLVDSVPLQLNNPANDFVGVNLYVDDRGSSKGLPINTRASEVALRCGKSLQVLGDAFIGRVYDNEEDFRRMDFTMKELNSSLDWLQPKQLTTTTQEKTCPSCFSSGSLRCSRCKSTYYCSVECQKSDWKLHKRKCQT